MVFSQVKHHLRLKIHFQRKKGDDRTGLVTVHPELLDKDGSITDEDLLTVRFSKDTDHPQSSEKPSE